MDIQHGIPYMGSSSVRVGTYSDCANCDLIIITAGRNRRPTESRIDMIYDNISIMKDVVNQMMPYYSKGVILIVSNPVDILTFKCDEWMSLDNGRIMGTGCILDTSRLIRKIADYTKMNIEAIKCNIVGEHGDTQFPVWSRLAIAGVPMDEYCNDIGLEWSEKQRDNIYRNVKNMGTEIITAKGRTHFGIATCVCSLADAILNQRPTIASVTTPLKGEYGIKDVAISLPSIVGVNGVEHRLEEHLTDTERKLLHYSADSLNSVLSRLS